MQAMELNSFNSIVFLMENDNNPFILDARVCKIKVMIRE
jgi:hypothetical protein